MYTYSPANRFFSALLALAVAVALVYLGLPRTISALHAVPGNGALREIRLGRPVSEAAIRRLIASRRQALAWSDRGRDWMDLALAQMLLTDRMEGTEDAKTDLIRAAAASLERGLARAPLNPHAWTRLAFAEWLLDGATPRMASALRMSLYTGPHEPRLVFVRLRLCFLAWAFLNADDRAFVDRQIRFAWQISKSRLVEVADRSGHLKDVRLALLGEPGALAEFERKLRWQRRHPSPARSGS